MNDIVQKKSCTTVGPGPEWERKLALVKSMVASECTDDEFALLCHLAKTYQLDPLAREIWAIKYGSAPATIFVGHAGLINLALRSGMLDGLRCEIVNPDSDDPVARATVWRKDMSHPIEAEVYWSEYGRNAKNPIWKTKPRTMLRKTAEVHALRRAFALSGLYTEDEMDHVPQAPADSTRAENVSPADTSHPAIPRVLKVDVTPVPPRSPRQADPTICAMCGVAQKDAPGGWLVAAADGQRICATCRNKGAQTTISVETESHVPSSTDISPNGRAGASIGNAAVCSRCGKQITNAEERTSRLMFAAPLCRACIQANSTRPEERVRDGDMP